ncbi:MAG: hypothetical protein IKX54_04855 [Lachnospiraceae bacterium]|nr:hypothetical protein [Lachnospiraceae bacterium]
MYQDRIVLCGSNAYEKKYYLNDDFRGLPSEIQKELKIMCVLFTEKIGGVLTLEFDEEGNLEFHTNARENDVAYDDIGSGLEVKRMRDEKRDLLEALEMYVKVFFLGLEEDGNGEE